MKEIIPCLNKEKTKDNNTLVSIFLLKSVFLIELFYLTCSSCESLSTCVERMAVRACINLDFFTCRTCFKFCTARCTYNLSLVVIWMNSVFHVIQSPFCLMPLYVHKESALRIYHIMCDVAIEKLIGPTQTCLYHVT